jgi:selenocysteine lyase/cysteine desulfurase
MPALLDRRIDALRASEYWDLDAEGRAYLDYTGAGLPAQTQRTAHTSRMHGRCFGVPRTGNPASAASTELTEHLLGGLGTLRHCNGEPMIHVPGPSDTRDRGGMVAFSPPGPHGTLRNVRDVERATASAGISVRTGCFCNPGAAEAAPGFTRYRSAREPL